MSEKTLIVTGGGIGDSILGFQCAKQLESAEVMCLSRKETFDVLLYLFGNFDDLNIVRHRDGEKWGENNQLLDNFVEFGKTLGEEYDNIYYVIPDLLFRNPLAFDFKKHNVSLKTIVSTRLLTKGFCPEKKIYIGLNTTTPGYSYEFYPNLVKELAIQLPDYEIFCPIVKNWNGQPTNTGGWIGYKDGSFPSNVTVKHDLTAKEAFSHIFTSCYGIYTDNGPSHVAYQMGQPRLLLDPRYGYNHPNLAFASRWRENCFEESIPILSDASMVAKLVKTNIAIPQTTLIPRMAVFNSLDTDWSKELLFKF